MTAPVPESRAEYAAYIAHATQILINGLAEVPHRATLDTLLSAYATTLTRHHCCIPAAVVALRDLASTLEAVLQASASAAVQPTAAPTATHH